MKIRNAVISELKSVVYITHKTIEGIYPAYYPAGAVDFFIKHHSPEIIKNDIENNCVFVLMESDNIVGTVTIKENSVNRLFVLQEQQRKGYGSKLMDFAENVVFENFDVVQVDASFSAKSMYLKRGYSEVEYHCIKTENGQFLCYDVMKKEKQQSEQT